MTASPAAKSQTRPDLIVAIDFGMTCTGVAYANPSIGSDTVRWIQKWPGRMQANENKVPTILMYPSIGGEPSSWGFLSESPGEQNSEDKECREWFKTFLDEDRLKQVLAENHGSSDLPRSITEVEGWYRDYLAQVYRHVQARLPTGNEGTWDDANVEYLFSVPTTWSPHPTVERFRKITNQAGFGNSPNHSVNISLTEAEAAAVHMAREAPAVFKENDILLVCDVGGGTTDLSALRVKGVTNELLNLQQIDVVFGTNIGSALIDRAFELMVLNRLEQSDPPVPLGLSKEDVAWRMMKSREYQNAKCEYGSSDDTPNFSVAVPELIRAYDNEALEISNGEMNIKRDDLRHLFDIQIEKLFELIDKQLARLEKNLPNEQVAHLVLSGGLGNSLYVQNQLRGRYGYGASSFNNAARMRIQVAPDPQLAVCKGIVADRLAKLKYGTSILGWRCCRSSYGTLCKSLYDPKNPSHFGRNTLRDPLDGKLYVTKIIDWFIKKGEPVSIDHPIVKNFRKKMTPGDPNRVFPTAVISSDVDADLLPFVMDQSCIKLCNVLADFTNLKLADFKLKNRHFWNVNQEYHRVDYDVKIVLGSADICFELWFNGQKLSKDHPIRVEWQAASAPTPQSSMVQYCDDPIQSPVDSDKVGKSKGFKFFVKPSPAT